MSLAKSFALIGLPLIAITTGLAAKPAKKDCPPSPAASCNPSDCCRQYCLGPDNVASLAAVGPRTCNGDVSVTVSGFYWNAHQDGMAYAIETEAVNTGAVATTDRRFVINGDMKNPNFKWDFGFKLGLGYVTACDGWDVNVLWTSYNGKASSHIEAQSSDNTLLLTLWSDAYQQSVEYYPLYATDIETSWKLGLNLVDIELGRDSWFSKRLSVRPHIGLRIASIKQDYNIEHKGGAFSQFAAPFPANSRFNDFVALENNYKGVGIRGEPDTVWNMGCGWGIYGNLAFSVIYGRFDVDHDEYLRNADSQFDKEKILETSDHFRASRYITDVALGVRYATSFCECKYALAVSLGWEQHLFLNQNQLWRATRNVDDVTTFPNHASIFQQSRGDLDTQGWTLTVKFDF